MADVCISYDEKSAESVARQIANALEKDGISCWYVGRDMEKGALRGAITEAIEDCRVFLLILSEKAMKSAYVKAEIALAEGGFDDGKERKLIAFRIDDSGAEAQLGEFLDELRARDDFPSDIAPFQIADGCPLNMELWKLKMRIKRLLKPQKPQKDLNAYAIRKSAVIARARAKRAKQKARIAALAVKKMN